MQIECSITVTSNDGMKHYLQRDSPIIIFDSDECKVFEGNLKGISFWFGNSGSNSNLEVIGVSTYNASNKTLCSVSKDDIKKIEVTNNTFNLYVKYYSTVIY